MDQAHNVESKYLDSLIKEALDFGIEQGHIEVIKTEGEESQYRLTRLGRVLGGILTIKETAEAHIRAGTQHKGIYEVYVLLEALYQNELEDDGDDSE